MTTNANTDRLLSEGPTKAPGSADNPLFDPLEWLKGTKPIERTIRLYQRLDLMADRDEAAGRRQDLRLADPTDTTGEQAALTEVIRDLTNQMNTTALRLRLRGFTRSKAHEIIGRAEQKGLKGDDANYHWVAAHIIEPEGIDWTWAKALDDALPVQFMQIVTAVEQIANATPDVEATVPF